MVIQKIKKAIYVEDGYTRLQRIKQKTNEAGKYESFLAEMTPPVRIINAKKSINDQRISIIFQNISHKTILIVNFECFGDDYNGFRNSIEEEPESNTDVQLLKPKEIAEVSLYIKSDVFYKELSNVKAYPTIIFFENGSKWIYNKNIND